MQYYACAGVKDVQAAVRFVKMEKLSLAVKGGGHSWVRGKHNSLHNAKNAASPTLKMHACGT